MYFILFIVLFPAGLSGGSFRPNQSNSIASYVTLRRGPGSAAAKVSPDHGNHGNVPTHRLILCLVESLGF